jgi:hypothetical protein
VTEHDWLTATDPTPLLEFLRDRGAASEQYADVRVGPK